MKKRYYISFALVLLVTMLILGTTYAYYKTKINGNSKDKSISVLSKYLAVKYSDGTSTMNFDGDYFFPGDSAEKTFSVENTGSDKTTYSIKIDNVINEFERIQDIRYKLYINEEEVSSGAINNSETQYLYYGKEIEKGIKDNIKLVVSYSETEESQNVDMNKALSFRVNIDNKKENKTSGSSVTFLGNGNPIENYRIYGNSVQNGTPTPDSPVEIESVGDRTKNLFDINQVVNTNSGIVNKGDGSLTVSGYPSNTGKKLSELAPELKVGDTIVYSMETDGYFGIYLLNATLNYSTYFINKTKYTITQDMLDSRVYLYCKTASNGGGVSTIKNIQIELGETFTKYEPYGKYKIPVTVSGKNMFNRNAIFDYVLSGGYLEVTDTGYNILKTASFTNGMSIGNFKDLVPNLKVGDKFKIAFETNAIRDEKAVNYIYLNTYKNTLRTNTEYTATEDMLNSAMYIYSGGTENCYLKNIMVYKSTETSDFEPYQETVTKNIYLDEPLRKIGEYADYVDFKEQKVVRKIYSQDVVNYNVNLNYLAAERWQREGATSFYMSNFLKYESLAQGKPHSISNRFKDGIYWEWKDIATPYNYLMAGSENNILYIIIENKFLNNITADSSETEKLSAFKEYLDNNLITVNYVMNTPIEKRILLPSFETNNGINYFKVGTATSASNIDIIS